MLTLDHPSIVLWRASIKHVTDDFLYDAIDNAYARVDEIATRPMSEGARDLAAMYVVRLQAQHCDERQALTEIVEFLTGGAL